MTGRLPGRRTRHALAPMPVMRDALGVVHAPVAPGAPLRIVCLVPSLTELLCDLGLQPYLVGRTGFCIHPREQVQSIEKIGGTKDVRCDRIRALAPTHLVVNIDENEKPTVDALAQSIPHVIVTHPQAPADNLALYRLFGAVFGAIPGVAQRAQALCARFDSSMAALAALPPAPQRRVLYCIWQDPWMTVTRQTYIGQMLALIGWQQWEQDMTADLPQQDAPAAPPVRYPVFTWSPELLAQVDLILLSTEPYSFRDKHADLLAQKTGKPVLLVDGEMLSWYGSRAIAGLDYLGRLRAMSAISGSGD
jgi:ABC-type Fe3+-hydroxamate transport system substrate-binding protein